MFKILSYELNQKRHWGICDLSSVEFPIKTLDVTNILSDKAQSSLKDFYSNETFEILSKAFDSWPSKDSIWVAENRILPPIPQPTQIVGVGLNYQLHREEVNSHKTLVFPKNVAITSGVSKVCASAKMLLDWEIEIGVVLGDNGTPIGFVLVNDISDRIPIILDPQWGYRSGKEQDTFLPVGPFFVPISFVKLDRQGRPHFPLELFVNGKIKQKDNSTSMILGIFKIKEQVLNGRSQLWSHTSKESRMTLPQGDFKSGDLILTGTPGGVAINPPTSLRAKLGIMYRTIKNSILEGKFRTLKEQFILEERSSQKYLKHGDTIFSRGGILGNQTLSIEIVE